MMSNTSSDMEHCSNLTKESEFSGLLYTSTLNSGTVVDVCCFCYYYYYYQAESTTLPIGVLPSHSPLAERCPREKFPLKAGLLFTRGATMRKKWKENRRIFFFAGIAQWPMYSKRWNLVKLYWIYSSFLYEVNKREHRTAALKNYLPMHVMMMWLFREIKSRLSINLNLTILQYIAHFYIFSLLWIGVILAYAPHHFVLIC